uniref:Glutaredoxin domain-containing protein n=1 Tax=Amorphochlora amoebiformis TaxID=1561963 RepID=A0A6T6XG32_9EUKA|mmetsp:Transcript_33952/g.54658  ORF Transcript_33952/g.54658 Transcript_33952/m.54658 type:complete len:286 (+) Transcript_33952:53-910(+)
MSRILPLILAAFTALVAYRVTSGFYLSISPRPSVFNSVGNTHVTPRGGVEQFRMREPQTPTARGRPPYATSQLTGRTSSVTNARVVRRHAVEGAREEQMTITKDAAGEEKEGEEDLLNAIEKSLPPQDDSSLSGVGKELYNEWLLQAVSTLTVKVSNSPLNDLKLWLWKKAAGDYNKIRIKARIDAILDSSPVVVFGAGYSPFTKKALRVLDKIGANYKFVPMNGQGSNGVPIRAYLGELTGRTSLPSIWIDKRFIGGCYDGPVGGVASMDKKELTNLLNNANAL